jgi:hypothetical protein
VSLALKFLREGDLILSYDVDGRLRLEPIYHFAHAADDRKPVDLVVVDFERADGSAGQIKLTPDHMMHIRTRRTETEGPSVLDEAPAQPFVYERVGPADFRGERGGLSFEHLIEAGHLRVGDQIWHQPLPSQSDDQSASLPPLQSARVVGVSRRVELAVVQVPEVRSMRPLLDGLAASTLSLPMFDLARGLQPLLAPLVWLRGESVGRTVADLLIDAYLLVISLAPQPTSPGQVTAVLRAFGYLPQILRAIAAIGLAAALAVAGRLVVGKQLRHSRAGVEQAVA